ncbi:EAL domain-containing protein [Paraclostridium bifermentans]|uniref:EAL domain-containing protein n=1 Tax=Paraclostridium bifermentans TaxID=1490 RepID=UPI0006B2F2CC|nr:EAL domain-containing protein [Paraclostridium bifermentans]OSB11631.1 EAL domain-containing protein [Paraclostridium bifermentans]
MEIKKLNKNIIISSLVFIIIFGSYYLIKKENNDIIDDIAYSYENDKEIDKEKLKNQKIEIFSKSHKDSNDYFILGYYNINFSKNNKEVKQYFEKVVENQDEHTNDFAKLYSYYYLAKDARENGETNKALNYVEDGFNSISPKSYSEYKKIIWNTHSKLLDLEKGREIALKDFRKIKENEYLIDDESKLYFYKKMSTVSLALYGYNYDIETNLKAIELAKKLDKKEELYKLIIDLGVSAKQVGEYESAINIIKYTDKINIEDKYTNAILNCYKLINLAQIESRIGNYGKSLSYVKKIDKYSSYIQKDISKDVQVLKFSIESEYYTEIGNFDLAHEYLKKAESMIDNESIDIYANKELYYYKALANTYNKEKNYNDAIEIYKKGIKLANEKNIIEYKEMYLHGLMDVYSNLGDKKNEYKYIMELTTFIRLKNKEFYKNHYYENVIAKYGINKTKEENTTIKSLNNFFKVLIFILVAVIFKFQIYPIIYKYIHRAKVKKYIKEDNYFLNYQPIVNPKENKIMGFEALIRLDLKNKLIMPNIIIEEINKCDMMEEVSAWILKRIVEDFKRLKNVENINEKFYISINLSLKEIESIYIVETFKEIIKEADLPKGSICIEITENNSYKNKESVSKNIKILKDSGFLIALDDFGVDYSNISMLDKFEFDIIKLDKYFIDNIGTSSINKTLIETADYLSTIKDKTIVVEGVEEDYQMKIIKNTKSNKIYIQGYFYSKPLSVQELEKFKLFK